MLCFNKINAPDLGKESPVIIDVNDKEQQRGCCEKGKRPAWPDGSVSCLETALIVPVCMKPVLMILNDGDIGHSTTHRTALLLRNISFNTAMC